MACPTALSDTATTIGTGITVASGLIGSRIHIFRRRTSQRRPVAMCKSPNRNGRRICHNKNCYKDNACSAFAARDKNPKGYIRLPCRLYHRRVCMKHICRYRMAQRRNKVLYRFVSCWRRKRISDNKHCQRDRDYRHVPRPDRTSRHIQPTDIVPAGYHNPEYRRDCRCHSPAFRWG